MRNPRRSRACALAALPVGALLLYAAGRQHSEGLQVALLLAGMTALLAGLLVALQAHREARAQARLADGKGVLARWRVDAATWQGFLEREQRLGEAGESLPNELALSIEVAPEGFEVVIGDEAITVADAVYLLPRHGSPQVEGAGLLDPGDGGPAVAELRLRHPPTPRRSGGTNPPYYTRLSVPLPTVAWRSARPAIAHYAKGRPGKATTFMHGPGDGSDPEDLGTCASCGYRTHVFRDACPKCGGGVLSKRWARRFGLVLVVLGSVLAAGMGLLLVKLSPMLADPGVIHGGARFAGTRAQALLVWGLLGGVFLFGAAALAAGIAQILTGRRNLRVALLLSGIFTGLVGAAALLPGN